MGTTSKAFFQDKGFSKEAQEASDQKTLFIAYSIALQRAKNPVWEEVAYALKYYAENRIHSLSGIGSLTTRLGKLMKKDGLPQNLIARATTVVGEALVSLQDGNQWRLARFSGHALAEAYGSFQRTEGLRSCMTEVHEEVLSLYAEHPNLVELWVVYRGEKEAARALYWKGAEGFVNGGWSRIPVLDRVYYSEEAGRMYLEQLTSTMGGMVRGMGKVPNSQNQIGFRAQLSWTKTDLFVKTYPYMDTFKYLALKEGTVVLYTTIEVAKADGATLVGLLEDTRGYYLDIDKNKNATEQRSFGARINPNDAEVFL